MNKKNVILLLAGATLAVGTGIKQFKPRRTVLKEILLPIDTATFVETVSAQGEVDALFYEELRGPAGKYSKQIIFLYPEGSEIKAGELVAELDPVELTQHIEELREQEAGELQQRLDTEMTISGQIFSQEVMLERAREELNIAEIRKISMQYESETRRAITASEYNNVRRGVESAEKKLKQLEFERKERLNQIDRRIERIRKQIEKVQKQMEEYRFYAQKDSIVVYPVTYIAEQWKKAEEGDHLTQNREFARLPDFASKIIRVYIEEQWVNKIKEQGPVRFEALSVPGLVYHGTVLSVSTLAKEGHYIPDKKFFEVLITIDPSDAEAFARLKPGMVCTVRFVIRDHGTVLAIPKDYVRLMQDGTPFVYARNGNSRETLLISLQEAVETIDWLLLKDFPANPLNLIYQEH